MRLTGLFLITIFLIFQSCSRAQNNTINFSGTWTFSKDKSELGERPGGRRGGMAPSKMIVTQDVDKLVVESFRTNRDGEEVSVIETFALDGSESENGTRNRISISTTEWLNDGAALKISTEMNFSREGRDITMASETTWSMEEDELVLESVRSTPRGDRESKMVLIKEVD